MLCIALFASRTRILSFRRCTVTSHRLIIMSSTRHHDSSVLQKVPGVNAAVNSAASLEELVSFCRQQRLKFTVYTGAAGLALALCRAGRLQQRPEWLEAAQQLAGDALSGVASSPQHYKQESLLDGTAGVVLVNCLIGAGGSDAAHRCAGTLGGALEQGFCRKTRASAGQV
ncbi:hypothetical protein COO60DRAFT_492118 [Scenedesmus sp. NREL 46B-D3]|nr:hypothetical protein COO60DRAFT_492118 [Scenedesmus sp. NREL 46B-D3]